MRMYLLSYPAKTQRKIATHNNLFIFYGNCPHNDHVSLFILKPLLQLIVIDGDEGKAAGGGGVGVLAGEEFVYQGFHFLHR